MKLISLSLKNYRGYEAALIEFPEGLIGIVGVNGAGKSSLIEAIGWALYGTDAARTAKEQIKRQGAAPSDITQVILEFELDGNHFQVVREMKGAGLTSDAAIHVNKKPMARGTNASLEYITKTLRMDREAFFTSFFAKQKELNALSDLQAAQRKMRVIKMLGIDDIDRALDMLRADLRDAKTRADTLSERVLDENELAVGLKAKTDALEAATLRVEEAASKKALLKAELDELGAAFAALKEKRETHAALAQGYALKTNDLKTANDALEGLQAERDELLVQGERLKSLAPKMAEYQAMRLKLDEMARLEADDKLAKELMTQRNDLTAHLSELENDLIKAGDLEEALNKLRDSRGNLEEEIKGATEALSDAKGAIQGERAKISHLKSRIGELAGERGAIEKLGPKSNCPTCLRPLGEDFAKIEEHFAKEMGSLSGEMDAAAEQMKLAEAKAEETKALLVRLEKEQAKAGQDISQKDLEKRDIQHKAKEAESLKKSLLSLENKLKKLKTEAFDAEKYADLKAKAIELEGLSKEFIQLEKETERLGKILAEIESNSKRAKELAEELSKIEGEGKKLSFSKEDFAAKEGAYEAVRKSLNEAEIELEKASGEKKLYLAEVERLKKGLEDNEKLAKEIAALKKERLGLSELKRIFESFKNDLIGRIRPALSAKTSALFAEITEGRYAKVELSEDYELMIYDAGEKFSINRFSGGEEDLANLCLRIAISKLMIEGSGQGAGFIVLDEIFGSQDSARQENIIGALTRLLNQFKQVFIITHVGEIKDSFEHVISVKEDEQGLSSLRLE
ncbi:MAG: SMC family ATPase [Actinomycetota bacterium]|nr:SMC family ATPase [Actinomycetota bacterium]